MTTAAPEAPQSPYRGRDLRYDRQRLGVSIRDLAIHAKGQGMKIDLNVLIALENETVLPLEGQLETLHEYAKAAAGASGASAEGEEDNAA